MTEQWKSVPKKFCELCKCWYYNNKVSIQHHEQGVRHQENVKNKLRDIGRKGREQEHEKRATYNALMQMERGAMTAHRQDMVREAVHSAASRSSIPSSTGLSMGAGPSSKKPRYDGNPASHQPSTSQISEVVWYETKTVDESGAEVAYYWNMLTGETQWELPVGQAFVSLVQQRDPAPSDSVANDVPTAHSQPKIQDKDLKKEGDGRKEAKKPQKKQTPKKDNESKPRTAIKTGNTKKDVGEKPAVKSKPEKEIPKRVVEEDDGIQGKPFGDWQPVEVEETRKDEFAYLPHNRWVKEQGATEMPDPIFLEEEEPKEKITFTERTAPSLTTTSSTSTTFKKRKLPAVGRTIRGRDD